MGNAVTCVFSQAIDVWLRIPIWVDIEASVENEAYAGKWSSVGFYRDSIRTHRKVDSLVDFDTLNHWDLFVLGNAPSKQMDC